MSRFSQARTTLVQILLAVCIFTLANLLVIWFAQQFVPYNVGGYPYKDFVDQYSLPLLLQPLANFDGAQYIIIAADKYFTYQQAYFPFFPLLIRLFAPVFMHNYAATGILISFASLIVGLFLFNGLAGILFPEQNPKKGKLHPLLLVLLVLPSSFFFSAVYTESLFLLLVVGFLYFLAKKQIITAAVFAYFASLTRFAGILLLIPVIVELFIHRTKYTTRQIIILVLGPLTGLLTYMSYLYLTTHDALAFINAQTAFSNNRSTSAVLLPQVIYRYLKIFTTANFDFAYVVALLEFGIFVVCSALLLAELWRMHKQRAWGGPHGAIILGLLLFSCANLILPTLTGTLSSIPRYSLLSLSALPVILRMQPWLRRSFVVVAVALHMIVLALFAQGWFVS